MKQPSGFVDSNKPNFVCRLNKSIYGLKQAPRAWFTALHHFLLAYGFHECRSDASSFIYNTNGVRVYFLTYVDDIIITGSHNAFISHFIDALSTKFSTFGGFKLFFSC